jgi:hypothetical protein
MNRVNVLFVAVEHREVNVAGCCNPHHWLALLSAAVRFVTWPVRTTTQQHPSTEARLAVCRACSSQQHVLRVHRSHFRSQLF